MLVEFTGRVACRMVLAILLVVACEERPLWAEDPEETARTTVVAAEAEQANAIQQQLAQLYRRASPALVRAIGAETVKGQAACTGVIVTPEGHILVSSAVANQVLKVRLADGREVAAKSLGWSAELGIAMAKLDGEGDWPHVLINEPPEIRAGQAIVTFTYSVPDREMNTPMMELEWVHRVASDLWFMRPDASKYEWKMGGVAFDVDGRLLGIESATFPIQGTVFTHAKLVHSMWPDLLAGKNIDRIRLDTPPDTGQERRAPAAAIKEEAERRAVAACVRIRTAPGHRGLSGVIISKEGLVATVAHHFVMPKGRVTVSLPDGRDLPGEVIGNSFPSDIALVRIESDEELPYVESGHSTRLRTGDECVVIGYGPVAAESRRPEIRRSKIVEPAEGLWSYQLPLDQEVKFSGGDCGGGVFDVDGRLVAIANPNLGLPWPHENPRIEVFRQQWDSLRAPFYQATKSDLSAVEDFYLAAADRVRNVVVELHQAERVFALGTVVDSDGLIVSKASALPEIEKVVCRLADGRKFSVTLVKVVREHDLAVLKVEARDLKAIEWASGPPFSAGMLSVLAGPKPAFATIMLPTRAFPAERGHLRASFLDNEHGLTVNDVMVDETFTFDSDFAPFGPQPLRKGDVLLKFEDRPISKRSDLDALLDVGKSPAAVAGDTVRLLVKRQNEQQELRITLGPRAWPIGSGQSPRCSNFAAVASVATAGDFYLFGGPVVDEHGRALGLAIAGRQKGWALVLPADTVVRACRN